MATVECPHCAAANEAGSAFCQACGKASPSAYAAGPRVVSGPAIASTAAGMKLQVDELHAQLKKAAGALLAVAILQTAFGALLYLIMQNATRGRMSPINPAILVVFGVAVVFWALYFWARVNPLPAAIVGLVVYVTLWALDFIVAMAAMANNPRAGMPGVATGPFNGIVIKIIIVAMLARAIKAGQQYRKLLRQQQEQIQPLQSLPTV